jgi:ribosomal protein RSM22 (predicted rRNA methylase)
MTFLNAVAGWLELNHEGSLRAFASHLTETYRRGATSSAVDIASYLTTRAPATFAAISEALRHVSAALPGFAPTSCLDIGCGPGTASWAALHYWPDIAVVNMRDTHTDFMATAQALARQSDIASLAKATIARADIVSPDLPLSDLVIAAYVVAELPEDRAASIAKHLWHVTQHTLVVIEPGTPRGFSRINAMRNALIGQGANIAAPCTHKNICPVQSNLMQDDDWCHFSVRLARSRAHMHAKSGILAYEDEPFAYLAVTRATPTAHRARILAPPEETKFNRTFKTCSSEGLADVVVATRDKAAFKRVRKLGWGDIF